MALGEHLYNYIGNDLANYPGNYLEIGVFNGDGFARVAAKHKSKKCYALDPFIEDGYTSDHTNATRGNKIDSQRTNFYNNTKDLTNVEHFEATSVQFSNDLTDRQATDMNISYVLIDGSHHYDDIVNDYKLAVRLIQKSKLGTIIFDDLTVPDVKQACDKFQEELKDHIKKHGAVGGDAVFFKINL